MAENAARGIIEIDLDRPRRLWFNFRAMKELKEQHNIRAANIDKMLAEGDGDINYETIAILLAYGLRHEDPTITPDWVTDNVGIVELINHMDKLHAAFGATPAQSVAPAKRVK